MTDLELKTWLDDFKNVEDGDVKRNKFIIYVKKKSDVSGAFEPIGYKQESLDVSNNYDKESVTDVLGDTYDTINGKDETIEMSEYHPNSKHSKFLDEAVKLSVARLETLMTDYDLLFVYGWLKKGEDYLARQVENCTCTLDNLGGQAYTMANVTFSGISVGKMGTVKDLKKPTFVEATTSLPAKA